MLLLTTGKGVEGRTRAEVDQAQQSANDGREDKRPQRDFVSVVDPAPDTRGGDTSVAAKRPCAPRRGRQRADRGESPNAEDWRAYSAMVLTKNQVWTY